ncbi:SseB family protein [Schaalia hyovaginalis]|uniref:SseB family protein n=2 Tax=Schaalia hyovaginalis TaxID=29316 RepID=UPI0023FA23FB|nr:SseB family protein [Schaalia hyovaginalis]MCI7671241.1 SseB family protein [Schaalia hyovaginalis]MDY4493178.1 SseB family protein [Schaalia hyovaginalis]
MRRLPAPDEAQRKKLAERLGLARSDRSDDGSVLARTAAALSIDPGPDGGAARLEALVAALVVERVIVPVEVEAALARPVDAERSEAKHGDIDFARVRTGAGDALVVYSSKQTLALNRPADRPMAFDPVRLALVALVETAGRIVMDPGGSEVFIPRAAVAALAQKDSWLPAWRDGELLDELRGLAGAGAEGVVDLRVVYAGEGVVRVELLADASVEEGALRARITRAAQRIVSSKRLAAAADRVEIVPRLVHPA